MKKIFILMTCVLAMVGCKQKQTTNNQDQAPADSTQVADASSEDGGVPSLAMINKSWQTKPIKVENGGKQPNIITLLKAFNETWHMSAVDVLLSNSEDPKFTIYNNEETGGCMQLDRQNGYAQVAPGDSDDDAMEAAVWKRKNGHRLFVLYSFAPMEDNRSLPEEQAVCCYDYDPATETLTPEQNVITQFKPKQGQYAVYSLPQMGTSISIKDSNKEGEGTYHINTWNGDQFAEANAYTDKTFFEQLNGTWICNDENKPKLTFKITNDDDYFWAISYCGIYGSTEFDAQASSNGGFLLITENGEEDQSKRNPSINCKFWLTKDGQLKGNYYVRLNGGSDSKGEIILEKESQLGNYAE